MAKNLPKIVRHVNSSVRTISSANTAISATQFMVAQGSGKFQKGAMPSTAIVNTSICFVKDQFYPTETETCKVSLISIQLKNKSHRLSAKNLLL